MVFKVILVLILIELDLQLDSIVSHLKEQNRLLEQQKKDMQVIRSSCKKCAHHDYCTWLWKYEESEILNCANYKENGNDL